MNLILCDSDHDPGHEEYIFNCPGCGYAHSFVVRWGAKSLACRRERFTRENKPWTEPAKWQFNGDLDRPTFSPSLLYSAPAKRCHLFMRSGKIEYLLDCAHALAGKTVDIMDIDP